MITGRFAPSPTGRMHLGNIYSAVLSWLSAKSKGGRWILRIEDLDPQRSKIDFARLIEDDLSFLGLDFDEGGLDDKGSHGPYSQSHRSDFYIEALRRLAATGYTYPCTCTRAEILATQAPHQSDGRVIYGGNCRPAHLPCHTSAISDKSATRLFVPDSEIEFTDRTYGNQSVNLANMCGDFILRRADGAWAYQLAVVVDDAAMGVTEVVRGSDLLLSAAQQIYLYDLLGLKAPEYAHVPLLCNESGRRLSKRDMSLNMEWMRARYNAQEILGKIAYLAGQTDCDRPIELAELREIFDWQKIPKTETILC